MYSVSLKLGLFSEMLGPGQNNRISSPACGGIALGLKKEMLMAARAWPIPFSAKARERRGFAVVLLIFPRPCSSTLL
jgi:hypothetical protein